MGKLQGSLLCLCIIIINLHAQNLVAWYPFNGNANDAGGKGINPTYQGGAGVTLTADRFGNANSACAFDGAVGSYIRMPADSFPAVNRTISLWFNVSSVTSRPGLLGYGGDGNCGTTLFMALNLSGAGQYSVQGHCGNNPAGYSYSTEPVNAWYHWVLTINGAAQKIYVNGELKSIANTFSGATATAGKDFSLGVIPWDNGVAPYTDVNVGYTTGALDDIRVYDNAMTDVQVDRLYSNEAMGLVASYPFNQSMNDITGNNNNATAIGSAALTTDRFGSAGNAIAFNGSGDRLTVPDNGAWDFGSGDFTISSWVNASPITTGRVVSAGYEANDSIWGLGFGTNAGWGSGTRINYFVYSGNAYRDFNSDELTSYAAGQWAMVTVTKTGNALKFFFNGLPAGSTTINYPSNSNSVLSIGSRQYTAGTFFEYFNGKLDETRIYKKSLTDGAVLALYNQQAKGLVAGYYFTGNAKDSGSNGYNGITINNPVLTTDRFGNPKNAFYFNGADNYFLMPASGMPTNDRTVMFWMDPDSGNQQSFPVTYGGLSAGTSFLMGFNPSGNNRYVTQGHNNTNYLQSDPWTSDPSNNWTHFAVTVKGSTIKMYLNGALVDTGAGAFTNTTYVSERYLMIGGILYPDGLTPYVDASGGYFKGKLDDVKIYETALSDADIAAEYANRPSGVLSQNLLLPAALYGKNTAITIFDLKGRVVGRGVLGSLKTDLKKQLGLSGGMYIVQSADGRLRFKVLPVNDK